MPKNHTAMIARFIGPTPPPASAPGWTHLRGSSSMRQRITLPTTVPPTQIVWLAARFRTSAGHGPLSRPVSMLACQFDREMPQRLPDAA